MNKFVSILILFLLILFLTFIVSIINDNKTNNLDNNNLDNNNLDNNNILQYTTCNNTYMVKCHYGVLKIIRTFTPHFCFTNQEYCLADGKYKLINFTLIFNKNCPVKFGNESIEYSLSLNIPARVNGTTIAPARFPLKAFYSNMLSIQPISFSRSSDFSIITIIKGRRPFSSTTLRIGTSIGC